MRQWLSLSFRAHTSARGSGRIPPRAVGQSIRGRQLHSSPHSPAHLPRDWGVSSPDLSGASLALCLHIDSIVHRLKNLDTVRALFQELKAFVASLVSEARVCEFSISVELCTSTLKDQKIRRLMPMCFPDSLVANFRFGTRTRLSSKFLSRAHRMEASMVRTEPLRVALDIIIVRRMRSAPSALSGTSLILKITVLLLLRCGLF